MMTPPLRSERRQIKLARRQSESNLGSPLQLSIPSAASRQHHPLTPYPFESKSSARQGQKVARALSQSLASIINEEPSESHSQAVLESHTAERSYDSSSNSEKAVSPPITMHSLQNDTMTYYVGTATSQSRAFAQSPNLQARLNTLVRKASQLCAMSNSEVYLAVRYGGSFYVYNSVDMASHQAPEPEAHEHIVNVVVASSNCGMTV